MAALTLRPGGGIGRDGCPRNDPLDVGAVSSRCCWLEQFRAVAVAVLRVPCVLRGPNLGSRETSSRVNACRPPRTRGSTTTRVNHHPSPTQFREKPNGMDRGTRPYCGRRQMVVSVITFRLWWTMGHAAGTPHAGSGSQSVLSTSSRPPGAIFGSAATMHACR
jgi:hypothetical protein